MIDCGGGEPLASLTYAHRPFPIDAPPEFFDSNCTALPLAADEASVDRVSRTCDESGRVTLKVIVWATLLVLVEYVKTDVGLLTAFSSTNNVDRKSTRLNSSHQIISYAVFCLKKKNTSSR